MGNDFCIFIVDDDEIIRDMLAVNLSEVGQIEAFDSAESCLERLPGKVPGLFLLDVGLPGLDGYELCRQIRSHPETLGVPIIFVSGHDDLQSRLAGYDAGGDDFIIKPYGIAEIQHKVASVRRVAAEQAEKQGKVAESEQFVSLVLSNLDEYARLIKFLRRLNECADYLEIADALLEFLRAYKLKGVVQIRLRNYEATLSDEGLNRPLETSIINHIRTLERIFEFKTRSAYNFENLSVMVNNMPVDNPDLCGSIRDNLAIAAESANAKLLALQSFDDGAHTREEIRGILGAIDEAVQAYSLKYNTARYKGAVISGEMADELLTSFAHLGLRTEEEENIIGTVRSYTNTLIDLYDIGEETQATLLALNDKLARILAATV